MTTLKSDLAELGRTVFIIAILWGVAGWFVYQWATR
jgi:hypothetical protein